MVFPTDPGWVPSDEQAAAAAKVIAQLIPTEVADQPDLRLTPNIEFIDAGSNFGSLRCPACGQDLELSWWHEQMDRQYRRDTATSKGCGRYRQVDSGAHGKSAAGAATRRQPHFAAQVR